MKLEQRLTIGGVKRLGALLVVGLSLLLVISCGGGGGGGGSVSGSGTGSGLEVNTNSVSFTANYYGALPSNQPVQVTVTAPDAYYLIAGYPAGMTPPIWLDMSISESVSPFTLNLRITSTSVSPGTHQTTVRVACTRSDNSIIAYRDITAKAHVIPSVQFGAMGFLKIVLILRALRSKKPYWHHDKMTRTAAVTAQGVPLEAQDGPWGTQGG